MRGRNGDRLSHGSEAVRVIRTQVPARRSTSAIGSRARTPPALGESPWSAAGQRLSDAPGSVTAFARNAPNGLEGGGNGVNTQSGL
jgi:hypothetical protein